MMRIAFLCGSLEPGKDGVGDYTRRLAEECARQGAQCVVIAISDRHVEQITTTLPASGSEAVPSLRLPASLSWSERSERAADYVAEFDPEWVSLQFVCYTFHSKGLAYGLGRTLDPIIAGRKLHVMFHEVWLCRELGWHGKQLAVGALQRFFIQRFIRRARPGVMHTSNQTYAALLNCHRMPATELGLFGAIPIVPEPSTAWIDAHFRVSLGGEFRRESLWLFGFFGTLHPQWPTEPLLTHLRRAAEAAGRRPALLSVGRTGHSGAELWQRMVRDYSAHFTFVQLGEQPVEQVSEYLSYLDFGIATTPRSIIGKSSTVSSMLEHGLPVIVNRDDTADLVNSPEEAEPLLISCDPQLENRLRTLGKGSRASRRPAITRKFLLSLERASTSSAPASARSQPGS